VPQAASYDRCVEKAKWRIWRKVSFLFFFPSSVATNAQPDRSMLPLPTANWTNAHLVQGIFRFPLFFPRLFFGLTSSVVRD
jgi:hypothetical protein